MTDYVRGTFRRWTLLTAVYLIFLSRPVVVEAFPKLNPFSPAKTGPNARKKGATFDLNPFDDDDEDDATVDLADQLLSGTYSLATLLYGLALVGYSRFFPSQIHVITMMRSTGFEKIENGMKKVKQNIRQAIMSAIRHAPSLILLNKSLHDLDDRIAAAKKVKAETKKAKEDGVVTAAEERKIQRLQDRNIRAVNRDVRRLKRGASSIGRIIQVLDFDEMKDLFKNFFFVMTAVLSSGHSDNIIGTAISRWCHFLNLGSLLFDVNKKIGFPLSRLVHTGELFDELEPEEKSRVEVTGKMITYGGSGYLIGFKNKLGLELNSALVASAIVMRGLSSLTGITELNVSKTTKGPKQEKQPIWKRQFVRLFHTSQDDSIMTTRFSGFLMIGLAVVAMYCSRMAERGEIKEVPRWLNVLEWIENAVERLVVLANKIK